MYTIAFKLSVLFSDIEHILSPAFKHPRRGRLLFDYLRIRCKAMCNRWFHFTKEHFLSYYVEFPDYEIFLVIFRQVFIRHAYYFESNTLEPRIIDCGGNIGMTTLYFIYLYPKAHILTFEPSREVIKYIEHNFSKNNLLNVTLLPKAVYDSEGEMTMYPRGTGACGNTLDQGVSSATTEKTPQDTYTVEVTKLSQFISENLDLLKLDIEGAEGVVIRELHTANKLPCIGEILMEYHDYKHANENSLSNLLAKLTATCFSTELFFEDLSPASPHATRSLSIRAQKQVTTHV